METFHKETSVIELFPNGSKFSSSLRSEKLN
jgi:hypothetical protein